MNALGLDMDSLYASQLLLLLEQRLVDRYRPGINVSEEEIEAYYAENYVEPGRQRYEGNYPLYET